MSLNNKLILYFLTGLCCFCVVFLFAGCSQSAFNLSKNANSEVVKTYFFGKGEDFSSSISSGLREDPYFYDGVSNEKVEFSVVTIFTGFKKEFIQAEVEINDVSKSISLVYDPFTSNYIFDLEKECDQGDVIYITYNNEKIYLENLSKKFNIPYEKAFGKATDYLKTDLEKLTQKDILQAECYLRVLESQDANFEKVFWYFYVFAKNKTSFYCVIDPYTGEIIKSEQK